MLYDPIRKKSVYSSPEERVRQRIIQQMLGELGYPKSLLVVEQDVQHSSLAFCGVSSRRRVDLVCFTPSVEGLKPLLLVECKAKICGEEARQQVFGYNMTIRAPFLALADARGVETFWSEKGGIASVPFLPSYEQLVNILCDVSKVD